MFEHFAFDLFFIFKHCLLNYVGIFIIANFVGLLFSLEVACSLTFLEKRGSLNS